MVVCASLRVLSAYKLVCHERLHQIYPHTNPTDQNANEQGIRFTYPQTQSTTAEKEGSVSFDWANQQYMPYAEKEGFRVNIPFAKQQYVRYPFAKKSGFSIRLPQQQAFGNYQGIRYTWPQNQETSEKQSYSFQWPQQQGITVRFPQETAKKEGFNYNYPQVQENDAEKQQIGISVGWRQGQEQSQTGEEQRIVYRWPQSKKEKAKEEGITFTYPQKQTSTAEKEGFRVSFPQKEHDTAEAQRGGITINWPQV